MKILRNIVLVALPLLIFVNLYFFLFYGSSYEFRGFEYAKNYISTFNGWTYTQDTIYQISNDLSILDTDFNNSYIITDLASFFTAIAQWFNDVGRFFTVCATVLFKLPVSVIVDIIVMLIWFMKMFI